MKKLINALLAPFNLTIGRQLPGGLLIDHSLQDAFESAYAIVRPFTMLNRQRLVLLFELVRYCDKLKLPGSFVECGAWKGGAAGMMACAARKGGMERDLHLFDVFGEIGEPDWRIDGERAIREAGGMEHAQGRQQSIKGIYDRKGGPGTIDTCRELLEKKINWSADHMHFHQGWFQETLPKTGHVIGPIALLHIDADWYSSTKLCLDTLYDQVVSDGAVVIDDYGGYDGCRKAVDEFLASRGLRPFLNHVDEECVYWFKEK